MCRMGVEGYLKAPGSFLFSGRRPVGKFGVGHKGFSNFQGSVCVRFTWGFVKLVYWFACEVFVAHKDFRACGFRVWVSILSGLEFWGACDTFVFCEFG